MRQHPLGAAGPVPVEDRVDVLAPPPLGAGPAAVRPRWWDDMTSYPRAGGVGWVGRVATARLARAHAHVRAARQHALHQVSNRLVNTHDRLALEDLNVAGMLRNHRVARAVSDAAWAELARQIRYKQVWRGGQAVTVDRWFPSSKTCHACGHVVAELPLHTRVFTCPNCHTPPICRDLKAAINLAVWAERHAQTPDPEARGRVTNARRGTSAGRGTRRGETGPDDAGTSPSAARPA